MSDSAYFAVAWLLGLGVGITATKLLMDGARTRLTDVYLDKLAEFQRDVEALRDQRHLNIQQLADAVHHPSVYDAQHDFGPPERIGQ